MRKKRRTVQVNLNPACTLCKQFHRQIALGERSKKKWYSGSFVLTDILCRYHRLNLARFMRKKASLFMEINNE